jgi:hypothetical protein
MRKILAPAICLLAVASFSWGVELENAPLPPDSKEADNALVARADPLHSSKKGTKRANKKASHNFKKIQTASRRTPLDQQSGKARRDPPMKGLFFLKNSR